MYDVHMYSMTSRCDAESTRQYNPLVI